MPAKKKQPATLEEYIAALTAYFIKRPWALIGFILALAAAIYNFASVLQNLGR